LVALGHQVDVVCARPPGTPAQESVAGVEVHRVRDPLSRSPVHGAAEQKRRSGLLRRLVRWLYGQTWRRLYWPDYACGWYFPAVRKAAALIERRRHEVMVSVSHPFTGHLVGLALKRRFPQIRWLADMGDPFCLAEDPAPNNAYLYRRLNRTADQTVMRGAEAISVTTGGTRDAYARLIPECAQKIGVIPPLLSLPPVPSVAPTCGEHSPLKLVYAGTLYRNLRSPAALLALFERLVARLPPVRLELHFFGSVNDCAGMLRTCQARNEGGIFVHGLVVRDRVGEAMQGADVLVSLGNRSPIQLPSKVIEYAGMGKPILNLVTIEDDSSVELLASHPAALTLHLPGDTIDDRQVVKAAAFLAHPPRMRPEELSQWLAPFTPGRVCQSYLYLLSPTAVSPAAPHGANRHGQRQ
jgi:hypothetical protein